MYSRKPIFIILLLVALLSFGLTTTAAAACGSIQVTGGAYAPSQDSIADASAATSLSEFIGLVKNGNTNELVGVYVPGVLALPVVQQPGNNAGYVSTDTDVVTQFAMASKYGTTGLLAHNNLSGALFFNIAVSDDVYLVFGDGSTSEYEVNQIEQYQALTPYSAYSDFVDLATNAKLSATDLFNTVYRGSNQVVFQTCIEANGEASWGRLFITATPKVVAMSEPIEQQPSTQYISADTTQPQTVEPAAQPSTVHYYFNFVNHKISDLA